MANELEKAITIKTAIDKIDAGDFLLPSIQRRFVWNTEQIELLFDSIMQDYPINTFMFWRVNSDEIKNLFRFYDFLKKYIGYKGGNNEERKTKGYKDFNAVIDGQQRLNSLYIGLKGSYANRQYVYNKKIYYKDESSYPTRKLYLDLLNPIETDEQKKKYDFQLLIHNEHKKENEQTTKQVTDEFGNQKTMDCYWFEVGKILEFKSEHIIVTFLTQEKLDLSGFPGETLLKLYKLVNEKTLINYYLELEQDFDKILFEFIRTNSGGTKLSFADLLMSIITASWEIGQSTKGAREELDEVIREVREFGFEIDQDFVLKTCLVLVSQDIRFALKNFGAETIANIKTDWSKITLSIKATFELIRSFSFNNHSLRAKNSAIPIIYYLFKTNLYTEINKENRHKENRELIKTFLHISLLNKLFGGSSDGFQVKLRKVISENINSNFPLSEIKDEFKGTNHSFKIDDEKISNILRTSYDSLDSFYILSLLFPKFNFEFKNPNIDHLHPRTQFNNENYTHLQNQDDIDFYNNYYNSVLNLAILSEEQNKSKNKRELNTWIEKEEKFNKDIRNILLIPENIDLGFTNFIEFINNREILLTKILKTKLE
ncbi:MAG: DUF262 domain-containing protein [Bacteroidia bacterium]